MNKSEIYVKNSIANLNDYAKGKGFRIVFRNKKTNAGDFCIFIYRDKLLSKLTHQRYIIGFDGYWDDGDLSFDKCWDMAREWLRKIK